MEEKLYFNPASYGKEIKKKEMPEKSAEAEKGNNHRVRNTILFLTFIIIVILIIIWLLRGKTTTSGQYPENVKNESLSCASTTAVYEKVNERVADKRELKINAVFYGESKLSSIGLRYTQEFGSDGDAYAAEAILHAQLYRGLQNMGYEHSRFNNKFSLMDNVLLLTLQSDADGIDDLAKDYFLIPSENSPTTLRDYRSIYESQGFVCSSSIDNN